MPKDLAKLAKRRLVIQKRILLDLVEVPQDCFHASDLVSACAYLHEDLCIRGQR